MTIFEREIFACANLIIQEYGENATLEASMRADEFLEKGDHDGKRVWLRIRQAIDTLIDQGEEQARH